MKKKIKTKYEAVHFEQTSNIKVLCSQVHCREVACIFALTRFLCKEHGAQLTQHFTCNDEKVRWFESKNAYCSTCEVFLPYCNFSNNLDQHYCNECVRVTLVHNKWMWISERSLIKKTF